MMYLARRFSLVVIVLLPLLLGGCGQSVEPMAVLESMAQSMSQVNTTSFAADLELTGAIEGPVAGELTRLTVSAQGRADLTDREQLKYIVDLLVRGSNATEDTRVSAQVRAFSDYNYFRIVDISLPLGLPFSLVADSQWYQISNPDANEDSHVLGSRAWLTNSEIEAIRELVSASQIWVADSVLPDDTVNGFRAYHLTAHLDPMRLERFLASLDASTHNKLELDSQRLTTILLGHTYHLWVTKRDHHLSRLAVDGFYLNAAGDQVDFGVTINLSAFNVPVSISRPTNTRDFDINTLFGLPSR